MISEDFAFEQVDRLSGLRFFPSKPAGVWELVKALCAISANEGQAERYIDAWIMGNADAPTPAGVYDLATQTARTVPEFNPDENLCRVCGGTGWSVFYGPMPKHLAACQTPGVVRCECMRRAS